MCLAGAVFDSIKYTDAFEGLAAGARHPLLMARCLPALPKVMIEEDSDFEDDFKGKVLPFREPDGEDDAETDENDNEPQDRSLPRPIDLLVPAGKASVVLTGPNTGMQTKLSSFK